MMMRWICWATLIVCLTSCKSRPEISVRSADLMIAETQVSDGVGNSVFAVGHLKIALGSDVDLVGLAVERSGGLWFSARTCESHVNLSVWPYLFPGDDRTYFALVAYKDAKDGAYNLAANPEEICITVGIGSMNPVDNARSKEVRYELPGDLKRNLVAYDDGGGTVDFRLSNTCERRGCRPTYSTGVVR